MNVGLEPTRAIYRSFSQSQKKNHLMQLLFLMNQKELLQLILAVITLCWSHLLVSVREGFDLDVCPEGGSFFCHYKCDFSHRAKAAASRNLPETSFHPLGGPVFAPTPDPVNASSHTHLFGGPVSAPIPDPVNAPSHAPSHIPSNVMKNPHKKNEVHKSVPEDLDDCPEGGSFFGYYKRDFSDGAKVGASHNLVPDTSDSVSAPTPDPASAPSHASSHTPPHASSNPYKKNGACKKEKKEKEGFPTEDWEARAFDIFPGNGSLKSFPFLHQANQNPVAEQNLAKTSYGAPCLSPLSESKQKSGVAMD